MNKKEIFYQYNDNSLFKDEHGRYWTYFYYVNEIVYSIKGIVIYRRKKKVRAKQRAPESLMPKTTEYISKGYFNEILDHIIQYLESLSYNSLATRQAISSLLIKIKNAKN